MLYRMDGRTMHGRELIREYFCKYFTCDWCYDRLTLDVRMDNYSKETNPKEIAQMKQHDFVHFTYMVHTFV